MLAGRASLRRYPQPPIPQRNHHLPTPSAGQQAIADSSSGCSKAQTCWIDDMLQPAVFSLPAWGNCPTGQSATPTVRRVMFSTFSLALRASRTQVR